MCQLSVDIVVDHPLSSCHTKDLSLSAQVTGGQPPYTFEWRDIQYHLISTNNQISGLGQNTYQVTVKDASDQYAFDSISFVSGYAGIIASPATCNNSDGSASIVTYGNLAQPISYAWSNGATTQLINNVKRGETYNAQITDGNGCKVIFHNTKDLDLYNGVITIGSYSNLILSTINTRPDCNQKNGSSQVTVSGGIAPYTYIWNTTPVQTGSTATQLGNGTYEVTVTSADGCLSKITAYVTELEGVNASATCTPATCQESDASISLAINGGTAPYTFSWSNGATTQNISGIPTGFYWVEITDANGCKGSARAMVSRSSPILLSLDASNADCSNQNGSIDLTVSGGTAPYTYKWFINSNAQTEDITGLSADAYGVLVTDANGCEKYSYARVNNDPACSANISGKIFQDDNENCTHDANEWLLEGVLVYLKNASMTAFSQSDVQGEYRITAPYADTYQVGVHNYSPHYKSICPAQEQTLTVSAGINQTRHFGTVPKVIGPDLDVKLFSGVVRPGFTHRYWLRVKNIGTQAVSSGTALVQLAAIEALQSFSQTPVSFTTNTNEIVFAITNLQPGKSEWIEFSCSIPPSTLLNTNFNVTAVANPMSGDLDEANNTFVLHQQVVGSYDPNDITVLKQGDLRLNQDTTLHYMIRFQNTGTYPAEFVVIRDTLESDLNINSIRDFESSHAMEVSIEQGNVLVLTFNNIFLSDSTSNEPESHGFVSYTIDVKKNLTLQSEVNNRAAIYFDYNEPIITNWATSRMAQVNATTVLTQSQELTLAFPNPANDKVSFHLTQVAQRVEIISLTGQTVVSQAVDSSNPEINVSHLHGMYIYKIFCNDGTSHTGKLMVK
jgi:hypothetical protein